VSVEGRNAIRGSTLSVYRPTDGNDAVTWTAVTALADVKLELYPVIDEIARKVFGADVEVETMALTALDIRKKDGLVVSAGTYAGTRFRVTAAKPFKRFTQLALAATTEAIG